MMNELVCSIKIIIGTHWHSLALLLMLVVQVVDLGQVVLVQGSGPWPSSQLVLVDPGLGTCSGH